MRGVGVAVWLLVALSVSGAPAPFAKRARRGAGDLARMQGEWVLVRSNGKELGSRVMTVTFDRRRIEIRNDGKLDTDRDFRITLDTARSPRHIDLTQTNHSPNAALAVEEGRGIYRFEDETLHLLIRWNDKDGERPADFDSLRPDGRRIEDLVLKRKPR